MDGNFVLAGPKADKKTGPRSAEKKQLCECQSSAATAPCATLEAIHASGDAQEKKKCTYGVQYRYRRRHKTKGLGRG